MNNYTALLNILVAVGIPIVLIVLMIAMRRSTQATVTPKSLMSDLDREWALSIPELEPWLIPSRTVTDPAGYYNAMFPYERANSALRTSRFYVDAILAAARMDCERCPNWQDGKRIGTSCASPMLCDHYETCAAFAKLKEVQEE